MDDLGRGKRKRAPTNRYKPVDPAENTRKRKKVEGNFGIEMNEIINLLDGDDEEADTKISEAVEKVEKRVMEEYKKRSKS